MLGDVRPDTRIVVQLEQRQVFFVLMGILVLASGILVLGYVLGLNVATPATMSARALTEGRRAERSVVRQPAASDDKVELTFHEKVMSPSPAAEPLPEAPSAQEQARRGALAKAAVAKAAKLAAAAAKQAKAAPVKKASAKKAPAKKAPAQAPKRAVKKVAAAKPAVKVAAARLRPPPAEAVERKVNEATADALSILRKLRADHGKPAAPAAARVTSTERRYTVQVGAFQKRADALALLDKLRSRGHNPFLVSSKVRSRGRWFRVRVGRFADKDKATDYQRRVEVSEGLAGAFVARL